MKIFNWALHSSRIKILSVCQVNRVVRFRQKVGQIGFKWDKSGTFSDMRQNVQNSDMKSPGFVPIGADLTHLGPKSGHHVWDWYENNFQKSRHKCVICQHPWPEANITWLCRTARSLVCQHCHLVIAVSSLWQHS